MYRLVNFGRWIAIVLLALGIQLSRADAPMELGINPCTAGYTYSHYNDIQDWDVCIQSSLYQANDGGQSEDFDEGCPMLDSGDVLQAWNPEAGVCFQIQNEAQVTDNDVFTVTRDATLGQIRINLHDDLAAAGCVGNGGGYLLSPNNVYCIKDVGNVTGYTFAEIEAMAEAYFERLYECLAEDARQLQLLVSEYQRYVEFAYYSNPNIKIEWKLATRSSESSRQIGDTQPDRTQSGSTLPGSDQQSLGLTAERCKIPNISKIIGLINK